MDIDDHSKNKDGIHTSNGLNSSSSYFSAANFPSNKNTHLTRSSSEKCSRGNMDVLPDLSSKYQPNVQEENFAWKHKDDFKAPLSNKQIFPTLNEILFDKAGLDNSLKPGIPEVLQGQHVHRLTLSQTISSTNVKSSLQSPILKNNPFSTPAIPTLFQNNGSVESSSFVSPLNTITPPPCVIEPKSNLLATMSRDVGKNEDGLVPVPAASFFEMYDIKTIGPYKLMKTLGAGSTGKVKLAIHEKSNQKVAVKIVPREPPLNTNSLTNNISSPHKGMTNHGAHSSHRISPQPPSSTPTSHSPQRKKKTTHESNIAKEARLLREVSLLSLLYHPNIVSLYGYSISRSYYLLFMEYVEGGQLLDYVVQHGRLKEQKAREFFNQLLSAVSYCHSNSIVHRDLKIENILITKDGMLKLIDFGLSNFYDPSVSLSTYCGSLYYAAPELLCGKPYIGPEVDVWSLGVILFVLTTGKVPFDDRKLPLLHEKIKAGKVEYPEYLSPDLVSLLKRMLVVKPQERSTLREVVLHPWTSNGYLGLSEKFTNYLPERFPLTELDPNVVYGVVQILNGQYSIDLITRILMMAVNDWPLYNSHPIVSLYYLVKEKLSRCLSDGIEEEVSTAFIHPSNEGKLSPLHVRRYSHFTRSLMINEPAKTKVTGALPKERSSPGDSLPAKGRSHSLHGKPDKFGSLRSKGFQDGGDTSTQESKEIANGPEKDKSFHWLPQWIPLGSMWKSMRKKSDVNKK